MTHKSKKNTFIIHILQYEPFISHDGKGECIMSQ